MSKNKYAESNIEIVKGSGEREIFSEKKLVSSLLRSGSSLAIAEHIVDEIKRLLHDGMHTSEIYKRAFQMLRKQESFPVAYRYNLRNAMMELGPEGFVFEKFVGEIFKQQGYKVKVGIIMDGWCVEHEVDVSAKKGDTHVLVECKFHNSTGYKTDLKVALYVRERFQDIEKKHEHENPTGSRCHEGWLITNTKLTSKAIQYSECVGLKVVGWGYPKRGQGNLEDLVVQSGIYPVSLLFSLSKQQRHQLLQNGIVTCNQLIKNPAALSAIGISNTKFTPILKEASDLCTSKISVV
jgi:hypothetical protein